MAKKEQNTATNIFSALLFVALVVMAVRVFYNGGTISAIGIASAAIFLLVRNFVGMLKAIFKIFLFLLALVFVIGLIVHFLDSSDIKTEKSSKIEENTQLLVKEEERPDTLDYQPDAPQMLHYRRWENSLKTTFEIVIPALKEDFDYAHAAHEAVELPYEEGQYARYWGSVYDTLHKNDSARMGNIYANFDTLRQTHLLNDAEFADLVVTCVQDIPYLWLHREECATLDSTDNSYKEMHQRYTCLKNVKYSVQSPLEFTYNIKGDCDTRALLIYTILRHFGYDVAILISEHYGHAIIGLNIPARGDFVRHEGKKYYVWETTSTNYPIGEMPADFSNIKKWEVALAGQ